MRHLLRTATANDHERVDAAFSRFDLSTAEGRAGFLAAHKGASADCLARGAQSEPECLDMVARLADGGSGRISQGGFDPLAIRYVFLGARFGLGVLKRQWIEAGGPANESLFDETGPGEEWRGLLDVLAALDPESPRAARILDDVRAIFAIFALHASHGTTDRLEPA